jgi:hypothetical protein
MNSTSTYGCRVRLSPYDAAELALSRDSYRRAGAWAKWGKISDGQYLPPTGSHGIVVNHDLSGFYLSSIPIRSRSAKNRQIKR